MKNNERNRTKKTANEKIHTEWEEEVGASEKSLIHLENHASIMAYCYRCNLASSY